MGVMWNGVQRCGGLIRIMVDVKCGATDVERCSFRHAVTEMQNVWSLVRCGVLACGMLP